MRAATSTAIPVLAGWAAGSIGSGLIATLGAFTSRFGGDRPYRNRGDAARGGLGGTRGRGGGGGGLLARAARHQAATALHRAWNAPISFQPVNRSDHTLTHLRAHARVARAVRRSMSAAAVGVGPLAGDAVRRNTR